MTLLAARLRQAGALDDAAVEAVSEATGAPLDLVRAVVLNSEVSQPSRKENIVKRMRDSLLAMDSRVRRTAETSMMGVAAAFMGYFAGTVRVGDQLLRSVAILALIGGFVSASLARDRKTSGLLGGLCGLVYYFAYQLFATATTIFMPWMPSEMAWPTLIAWVAAGVVAGIVGHSLVRAVQAALGLRDAQSERQALVQQLVEIQDRLRSDEKHAAFLSLDIVGSTRMKAENDAIAIEYTFSEYHRYIEVIALKHGGRVHSTAGDGVICVFEESANAFSAGRAIMAGLFEFNAFRNKTKAALQLRAGLHSGRVGAAGQDASSVNFAHVIDVCAHLQKLSEPGTMAVSQATLDEIDGYESYVGPERFECEGFPAALWSPKAHAISITAPTA